MRIQVTIKYVIRETSLSIRETMGRIRLENLNKRLTVLI